MRSSLICTALVAVLLPALAHGGNSPTLIISPSAPAVGDQVTGAACGLQPSKWYGIDIYGPNTTVDGPLVSQVAGRASDTGCLGSWPFTATAAGGYSAYVLQCSSKGSQIGCLYGTGGKVIIDQDFIVTP